MGLRRTHSKDHEAVVAAAKLYRAACERGRGVFARTIPDMLKYEPKKFWNMFKRKGDADVSINA